MNSTQSIAEMMQDYAEQAVRLGKERRCALDFSEQSVQALERLLEELSGTASASPQPPAAQPDADELSRILGGYLGEVVRRRFGGEWMIEKYPAGDYLIVTLVVGSARLFPAMKIHRRLTQGANENVWTFYQTVREKLLQQPGAKIQ